MIVGVSGPRVAAVQPTDLARIGWIHLAVEETGSIHQANVFPIDTDRPCLHVRVGQAAHATSGVEQGHVTGRDPMGAVVGQLNLQIQLFGGVLMTETQRADDVLAIDETCPSRHRTVLGLQSPVGAVKVSDRDAALQFGRIDESVACDGHLGAVLVVHVTQTALRYVQHLRQPFCAKREINESFKCPLAAPQVLISRTNLPENTNRPSGRSPVPRIPAGTRIQSEDKRLVESNDSDS